MKYADTLAKMIRCKTVSCNYQQDLSSFTDFQTVLKEVFPHLFAAAKAELFGASLTLKWPGKSADNPVMFMNHQDVVPAEGKWKHNPFSGDVADGKIWGRGVLDDKGGLFAMLQAADELISEGFVPGHDIWFVTSCCEEVERDDGNCREIAAIFAKRGLRFGFVLDEGGMVIEKPLRDTNGTFAMVRVAEKGCVDLKFVAKSAGGHSSIPPKNTPLVRLGKFMAEADRDAVFKAEVDEVTAEMFRRLSLSMKGLRKLFFGHSMLFRPLFSWLLPRISSSVNAMLRTTVAFTEAKGSEAHNVIPEEAFVVGNLRTSHHQGREGSIEAIRKLASKYNVETEVLNIGEDSGISSFRNNYFKLIEESVSETIPGTITVPYRLTGASDSRYMCAVSDNVYGFLPFLVTDDQLKTIHALDENLDLDSLVPAVSFYRCLYGRI